MLAKLCALLTVTACGRGAPNHTISGTVSIPALVNGGKTGLSGVTLILSSELETNVPSSSVTSEIITTGPSGEFNFGEVQAGTYHVAPLLDGFFFTPQSRDILLGSTTIGSQDFLSFDGSLKYIDGTVSGAAKAGVAIQVHGPVSVDTTTDVDGVFGAGPLPDGTYTVTPTAPTSLAVFPSQATAAAGSPGLSFVAGPPAEPATIVIAGDAASGVDGGTFQSLLTTNFSFEDGPEPCIAVYFPQTDVWTFALSFDPGLPAGFFDTSFGGDVSFRGPPAESTYTQTQLAGGGAFHSFRECWSKSNGQVQWSEKDFTLTLTSVGTGVPAQMVNPDNPNLANLIDYPIHGTLHMDCMAPSPDEVDPSLGTVTVDVTF
jgi:hypothetical protein